MDVPFLNLIARDFSFFSLHRSHTTRSRFGGQVNLDAPGPHGRIRCMNFFAYYPCCENNVGSVTTVLGVTDLDRALESDGDIEVIHINTGTPEGDHRWRVNREEKS